MAAVAFACLVVVSAGPVGWVSSAVSQGARCVRGGGGTMIGETNFPDIFQGYESMIL